MANDAYHVHSAGNVTLTVGHYHAPPISHTLAEEIIGAIQDDSLGDFERILELFNECLLEIAGEFLLPELERWANVSTNSTNKVALPYDYMRNLRYCKDVTSNHKVKVYGSRAQLDRHFYINDQSGRVVGVAPYGRYLHYQRIPADEAILKINYFAFPDKLLTRDDKPECLPWHLAKTLLRHYTLRELWSLKEDGMEGAKVNTQYHDSRYLQAKEAVFLFVGPEEKEPPEIQDEIEWDNL
jgi:hypothetical protein